MGWYAGYKGKVAVAKSHGLLSILNVREIYEFRTNKKNRQGTCYL